MYTALLFFECCGSVMLLYLRRIQGILARGCADDVWSRYALVVLSAHVLFPQVFVRANIV